MTCRLILILVKRSYNVSVACTTRRRIAGLNENRAKAIVAWREVNGRFINREQLKTVKGIGQKSYEQCAGFARIVTCCASSDDPSGKPGTSKEEKHVKPVIPGTKRKAEVKAGPGGKKKKKAEANVTPNYLDMTCIHPESYGIAERFVQQDSCVLKISLVQFKFLSKASKPQLKNICREFYDICLQKF